MKKQLRKSKKEKCEFWQYIFSGNLEWIVEAVQHIMAKGGKYSIVESCLFDENDTTNKNWYLVLDCHSNCESELLLFMETVTIYGDVLETFHLTYIDFDDDNRNWYFVNDEILEVAI